MVIIAFTTTQSQYKDGSSTLLVNGAYTAFQAEDIEVNLNGYGFGVAYEANFPQSPWACGFGLSYIRATTDIDSVSWQYEMIPFNLYGKFFFGSPRFRGYISAGFGIHASQNSRTGSVTTLSFGYTGFTVNGGAGANIYLSEVVLVNLAYNISWWQNSYAIDNLGHIFLAGIGFQFN
jgi:hypothetical protein